MRQFAECSSPWMVVPGSDVAAHDRLHARLGPIRDHTGADLSTALEHSHDDGLTGTALHPATAGCLVQPEFLALMHVPRLAADEGFINFDFTAEIATGQFVLQRKTATLQHE